MKKMPSVWVLTANKPGHTTQSLSLAEALTWPYEVKALGFTWIADLHKRIFGTRSATCVGLDQTKSTALSEPWPDVLITTGWRPARVARWIRNQSRGKTHLVLLGRQAGQLTDPSDIAVSCRHFRQLPNPRRLETIAPLSLVRTERLEQAAQEWRHVFKSTPHPRIALLIGGSTVRYSFNVATARRLGEDVRLLAEQTKASVFVTTSRRTGARECAALREALGPIELMHIWKVEQKTNPYFAFLTLADVVIVTGESESMLADVAATEKPAYIYPLPERLVNTFSLRNLARQLKDWVITRAELHELNARNMSLVSRGITYQCQRLVECGVIRPRRDLNLFHRTLVEGGFAHFFGDPFTVAQRPALLEFERVARQVRHLLGRDT